MMEKLVVGECFLVWVCVRFLDEEMFVFWKKCLECGSAVAPVGTDLFHLEREKRR